MAGEQVLIVDDEAQIVRLCAKALHQCGYEVREASTGAQALASLAARSVDLLLVDLKLPDMDGLTVLRRGRELDPDLTAIVITGYATLENALQALRSGARGFILKPFGIHDLLPVIAEALDARHKEQQRLRLEAQIPIMQIGQAMMAEGDAHKLAVRLLGVVVGQVPADRAVLMLLDPDGAGLSMAAGRGLAETSPQTKHIPAGQGLAAAALQAEAGLLFRVPEDRAADPFWGLLAIAADAPAMILRLSAGKTVVGLVGLCRLPAGRPFAAADQALLTAMGSHIGAALENARLYEQVQTSNQYLRTVLDSLHDEVIVVDRDLVVRDANALVLARTGRTRDQVVGRHCYEVGHQRQEPCEPDMLCPTVEVWRTGRPARALHTHYDRNGERLYVDVVASPVYDDRGQPSQVVEACRDVTAEWRMESSLAAIRGLGQELVFSRDEAQIAQVVVDAAQRMLDFEWVDLWLVDESRAHLVWRARTPRGEKALPDAPPLLLDSDRGIMAATARSGEAIYLPDVDQDPRFIDGGLGTRSELCLPLRVGDRVIGVLNAETSRPGAVGDAEQRLLLTLADQAALALENARLFGEVDRLKEFNEDLIRNLTEGIAVQDSAGYFTFVNPAAAAMLGYAPADIVGRHWTHVFPAEEHAAVSRSLERRRRGESDRYETFVQRSDNTRLPVLIAGRQLYEGDLLVGSMTVFTDLTGVRQLQAQLLQSEKLAALGRLAASLAHEINNPLQALRSGLGLLVNRPIDDAKRQRYLEVASREVERLIAIVERMLNFYRPSADERSPTDVNDVLNETLTLAGKKLQHSHVTLRLGLAEHLPLIHAVADQLKQVFLNIIFNALDAMPKGGDLVVSTGCDGRRREVRIAFADSGAGIPAEQIPRIFEPFFTTKLKGTGLGLAVSYGIVDRHGGRIEVQSQVGLGTVFSVFLPLGEAEPSESLEEA